MLSRAARCTSRRGLIPRPHPHTPTATQRRPRSCLSPPFLLDNATSKRLPQADNYAEAAMQSIRAMQAQVGDLCFTADGIAKKGILLRHLVMPGYEEEGKQIVRWLAENASKDMYIHTMRQYCPRAHVGKERRTTGSGRAKDLASRAAGPGGVPAGEEVKKELRYQELNRAVSLGEVDSVRKAGENAGLWRFVEAAEHGGFNI
ncbi:hypothetical protein CLAFUW4_12140 [Fulvia fulva]|uniref:Uncharacterized protein n=1 Tax=Passalora fulva TaxID=5499 RepID=A0A9Q8PF19_PASFU|nr:uncharacterized protein CLAFUR5_11179 [Fulvia fulva]KAK4617617.1 hypothetical protein CLAFUR4_12145 [Fulvia fulva]KAK4618582.1 hypothetical protein CLAFUR0_12156 [Fulvia fulva]UJO21241.1 hypothetical protein CLAFUR5_11179 [Fulvia fulva]WPV18280.1 hypothetical protein CLAFUW4_12140 [Fulvia fulva]WPV33391.1 hypothetical protein CLAFUW7_12147 [Fulvia fulva]